MSKPDAELIEIFRALSDDELVERWREGYLTDIAITVARTEFLRRGMVVPEAGPAETPEPLAEAEEAVTFVTVARSLIPADLYVLRARLEGDGIPSFVVDDNIVRMNSLWSVAVGGARLLVPGPLAADAREIISLLKAGRFAIGEDN
ncbi:MAG: hypothetical protein HZC22_09375 [Rhodocyclales bacterium]|nr:hypothetical protein [Rhodocyclales bacterium]